MVRCYKILFFFLLCLITLTADAFTFSGHIKTDSLKALPYVSVYLKDVQMGTTTDLDGFYKLTDIPAGRHTLLVSHIGYETQTYEINLTGNGLHDFVMHEQAITLNDIFVSPTGESIERFVLTQVVKHTKKLNQRVSAYSGTTSMRFEQKDNNVKKLLEPYMGTIKFALGLLGYKKVFMSVINHPTMKIEMAKTVTMKNGKLQSGPTKMTYYTPQLDEDEIKAWEKKDWSLDKNPYNDSYQRMAEIKKELEKMDKKTPGKSATLFKYGGSYEENGKTIHILKYKKSEYHIVDGIWQIRRIMRRDENNDVSIYEAHQYKKDLYLPVSYYSERSIDLGEIYREELKEYAKEDTTKMSRKQLSKYNKEVATAKENANIPKCTLKISMAFSYKNLILQ